MPQSPSPSTFCKDAKFSAGEDSSWLHLRLRLRYFGGACIFKSRRRQQRRTLMLMCALLNFHLGEEHRRSHRRDRNLPALRSTHAVKYSRLISRRQNPRQRGQRRTHDVHAAHQFIGTPVRVYLVHKHRQHLERLRQRPRRQRKPSLNVVEVQAVGLALFLHFFNQLLPHFRFGHGFCGRDDQVPLASRGHSSWLVSSMTVRLAEILDGHPRHQKVLQHAVFDHLHSPRRFPLIVKIVRTCQLYPCHLVRRRVIHHAQEFRQHFLPDLLRERLSFFFIALPVAFPSVSQHFMEKHRRRAPAQYRRSI